MVGILADLNSEEIKQINAYSSYGHEIIKSLLSRFDKRIKAKEVAIIGDIIQNKYMDQYGFLFEILRAESLQNRLNDAENRFLERYEKYLADTLTLDEI